uniref:Follistatin-like domain-containing protein n=1 Tax=Acrobeloides nanus TaxID=290746 RepID=A0A914CZS1_9BILA
MGCNRFPCHRNFASASDKKDDIIPARPPEYQAPKPGRADEYYKLREEQREQEAYRKDIPLGGTRPTEIQKIGLVLTMIYPNKKVIPEVVSSATMRRMRYRLSTLYFFTFMLFILGWLNFTRLGSVCQEVQCFKAPCNPICVAADNGNQGNCSDHEVWSECGSCEPTCANRNPICTFDCKPSRCQCAQGFFRLGEKCVTENDCDSQQLTPLSSRERREWRVSCANMSCPSNQVCIEKQVQCIRAPCNPIPTCVAQNSSNDQCNTNEEFQTCGTACEPSCENPNPTICTMECIVDKCQCKAGFVRKGGKNGSCVPKDQCSNSTASQSPSCNTVKCRAGYKCELQQVYCYQAPCPKVPRCVPDETQQTICSGENEEFKQCGACDQDCGQPEKMCKLSCALGGGCGCKSGYVRNSYGTCILKSACPDNGSLVVDPIVKNCSEENEEFKQCGACDQFCGKPERMCKMSCNLGGGCGCINGYVRNSEGKCVLPDQCTQDTNDTQTCTGQNEEYKMCGACDNHCNQPQRMCNMMCSLHGGCGCKNGYVRNAQGLCVLESECPGNNTICDENETLNECGNLCELQCGDEEPKICPAICAQPACTCAQGYYRNTAGKCVPNNQCTTSTYTCANVRCASGTVCIMKQVLCKKAPCSAQPTCVSTGRTCADTTCPAGNVCVDVQCFVPPCNAICEPVDSGSGNGKRKWRTAN